MPAAEAASAFTKEETDRIFQGLASAGPLALAVSGGSDSVAMMRLAAAWAGAPLRVLTVDHGLRPESAAEARRVAGWAGAVGLPHDTLTWEGPKPTSGIQAAARKARYRLLLSAAKAHGCHGLLTAHTIEDQAETVLMRLRRTASPDALAGISPALDKEGVRILRPLLGQSRERLRAHLSQLGQSWIDDPSNDDDRFERVRIRKALAIAGLEAAGFARLADEQRAIAASLWAAARLWITQKAEHHDEGFAVVKVKALADLGQDILARALGLLVARYGAGEIPEPRERGALGTWLKDAQPSRRTLGGAVIARRKTSFLVGREPGRIAPGPLTVASQGRAIWDGRFDVTAPPGAEIVAGGVPAGEVPAFVRASYPKVLWRGEALDSARWSLFFVMR